MAEKKLFSVTLADGTQLNNLELNGSMFKSDKEISASMFAGKLSRVFIDGDAEADSAGLIGEHHNMEVVQITYYTQAKHGISDGWYFALRDIPASELEKVQMQGDIAYLSMMSGIELD